MDTESKYQYMKTLKKEYSQASRSEKTKILDEYCKRTNEDRKYAIKKFRGKVKIKKEHERKQREQKYDGNVIATLVTIWKIFDYPCGQRLETCVKDEVDKLYSLKEIACSDGVIRQLKEMSSATMDRRLKHEKEVLKLNQKYKKKREASLLSKVPTKTSADIDSEHAGFTQIDCVEHNGGSPAGEYINSLTTVDTYTGWWEGEGLMGGGQRRAFVGIKNCRGRSPVPWTDMHPDNGGNILNWSIYAYAEKEDIKLSRSRAYKKNDNCFVEQKNRTHVRDQFGHLRYDTVKELEIMNDLYRNELRLYKNFCQPVMKLISKEKLGSKRKRKYDKAQTPYKRVLACDDVPKEVKYELTEIYESINPAELKREIDRKTKLLRKAYEKK